MNLERLIPPALAWRLNRKKREAAETALFSDFYRNFLKPGDLCFDIGANLGNRVRGFLALDCRVVALEPQSSCFAALQREFGNNTSVTLVKQAVASEPGELELQVSPDHVLSSFSEDFIERTSESGRFAASKWNRRETCRVTTLDALIAEHGLPGFIKIDVEGFEPQVLAGLSVAVPALSIEWTPELPGNARDCILKLASLSNYEFNVSWGEGMKFSRKTWRDVDSILNFIDEFREETTLFGDIYARQKETNY